MNIEITQIRVLTGAYGTDKVLLETKFPSGTYPFEGVAVLTLEVARGKGVDYCVANFGKRPDEVIVF